LGQCPGLPANDWTSQLEYCGYPKSKKDAYKWWSNVNDDQDTFPGLCKKAKDAANGIADGPEKVEMACDVYKNRLKRIAAELEDGKDEKDDKPQPQLANEFEAKCHVDTWSFHTDSTTRIDFLALKGLLTNVVEVQEKTVYRGVPDLTLSQLVLTSSFNIVLEASAGTRHFFRIVPLLAPPTTDIRADHTHSLKVTLSGKKNKGDKQLAKKLVDSCRERVKHKAQSEPSSADAPKGQKRAAQPEPPTQNPDFCNTEPGQLLEAMVQALEKGGASGSAGQ
jgi:hypothetical protein